MAQITKCTIETMADQMQHPFRVLEFYSGIGGMRYALQQSRVSAVVVEAFDINDMANDVYEHNFHHRPNQGNIQHLTVEKLDSYEADVWLLSPPCQPYTRQGLKKDSRDSRAASFLTLLEMLSSMLRPPSHLFVENVVGFECSTTHDHLMKALKAAAFSIQEFILTPLQFGIPYSRPRYFCLAKRKPFFFFYPEFNGQLLLRPLSGTFFSSAPSTLNMGSLSSNPFDPLHALDVQITEDYSCHSIREFLEETSCNDMESYKVADALIDRWGDVFDVVAEDSKKCCCFTKSYGRFIKGTGSFLTTKSLGGRITSVTPKTTSCLKELGLRYFTPREIANLHSFPKDFSFPSHITVKQRYALLGNSLSVIVVASLLQYLLQEKSILT